MNIVLHSDDINLLSYWHKALAEKKVQIEDDLANLSKMNNKLIILNYSSIREDEDFLSKLIDNENKILMLHRVPSLSTAKKLLKIGIQGYGNALMKEHFILAAIATIEENLIWLYPELTSELITEIPSSKQETTPLLEKLTIREKEVALLLKDAYSYKKIAETLDITPRTVKAHAGHIYTKLDVKDRLGLALLLK